MRVLGLVFCLSGCALFRPSGSPNVQNERNEEPAEQLAVTLVSRCDRPARVCYAPDRCLTLVRGQPRHLRAPTRGTGEVFVTLEGTPVNVSADQTFNTVELDESCAHLGRKLATR